MFGRTVELRRAVHRRAVRVGLAGSTILITSLSGAVVLMQAAFPGGHLGIAFARTLVPVSALLAVVSAGITVFASPLVFGYGGALASLSNDTGSFFMETIHSDNAYERAAGRLGLLSIAQMFASAIPAMLGFVVFVAGASASVFSVFVALSIVILAAVCPRASEWDDEVDRLVARSQLLAETLEDSAA